MKIGLIAGNGEMPLAFARAVRQQGGTVAAVAHHGETAIELTPLVDRITWIQVGQLGKLIEAMKSAGVESAVMLGGIRKTKMFSTAIRPDLKAVRLMARLSSLDDDSLLRGVAEELQREGIRIEDPLRYLAPLLAPVGLLGEKPLTEKEREDVRIGWEAAGAMGRYGVGQCVVVKDRVVLSVEAIEGTDETIRRAGELGGEGCTVVKRAKPGQDLRFDLPTVGPHTIEAMEMIKARVLAIEAGRTLLLERDRMRDLAATYGISIVGWE
jgi:DUF1009 family protein